MGQTINIAPVTRIEGHGKIAIHLDDGGNVTDARFHVTEFRGFEKFCEGRTFPEMPGITMRICGICPVSHMLASAKACDGILATKTPPTAVKLRRLINTAQYIQSHALSFFHLSAPDLLLGMESDPATRNVVGLIRANPAVGRKAIRLRQFGQEIIRQVTGKSVHPSWATPGGVREGLTQETKVYIKDGLSEALETTELAIDILKTAYPTFTKESKTYGDFDSLFIGLVTPDGGLEHYDGLLRVMDKDGKFLEAGLPLDRYQDIIAEAVEPWSYLKFPYYKPFGYSEAGMYRVGPLARINICDYAGTPRADREIANFRKLGVDGKPVTSSFHFHYARLIELLFSVEKMAELVEDPEINDTHIRAKAGVNSNRGIGIMEAPRGTLIHDYEVDDTGIIKKANLLVATGNNNMAMNKTVKQIAQAYVKGPNITEGLLNRVEHGIRLYDPCLSCSTHAVGKMPLHVRLYGPDGEVLDEKVRN